MLAGSKGGAVPITMTVSYTLVAPSSVLSAYGICACANDVVIVTIDANSLLCF